MADVRTGRVRAAEIGLDRREGARVNFAGVASGRRLRVTLESSPWSIFRPVREGNGSHGSEWAPYHC